MSKNKKILIVDDSAVSIKSLVEILTVMGFPNVVTADNIVAAYESLVQAKKSGSPFDLVICDHHMPSGTGLMLIEKIRANSDLASTAFIALTSDASRTTMLPYVTAGADAFLTKPPTADEMLKKIMQVWSKRGVF